MRRSASRLSTFFTLAAGTMLSLSVWGATDTTWIDDPNNRGTEASPINLYDKNKWTSGALPSSSWNLNFTAGGLTYITNSTTKQVATALRFGGGDFVVFGPMTCGSFGYNFSETASVSIDKRGNWTCAGRFYTATANGSHFSFTNHSGKLEFGSGGAIRIGSGANSMSSFVLEDGVVTSSGSGYNLTIGYGSGSSSYFIQNGGKASVAGKTYIGYGGTGNLTINDGTFTVGDQIWFGVDEADSSGNITLNGGTLETSCITCGNAGDGGTILFNGGTLKVTGASSGSGGLILDSSKILVRIGEGGGTIDTGGFDVNYGKPTKTADGVTNDGGLTIVGGGFLNITGSSTALRLDYNGRTTIELGTRVSLPSPKVGGGLTFTIPDGLAPAVYNPLTTTGSSTLESVFNAAVLPSDPDARFELSQDKKRIICYYKLDDVQDPVWIGGVAGDLGLGANWSTGTVPQGGNCYIGVGEKATLTSSASFRPDSITFMEGSKSVTIEGVDDIAGITVVTNLSAVNHTINVPVRFADKIRVQQGAMAYSLRAEPHVIFQGGAYGTMIDNAYSRFISGHYFLSDDTGTWTVTEYSDGVNFGLLEGSSISIPYLTNVSQIFVGGLTGNTSGPNGGALTTGVYRTSGRICRTNQGTGEFVVTNELYLTLTADNHLTYRYGDGWFKFEKVTIGKDSSTHTFYFANSVNLVPSGGGASFPAQYRKNIRVGAGGLGFEPGLTKNPMYQFGRHTNDPPVLAAWHDDFTIGTKGQAGKTDVTFFGITTTFDTTDEAGVGRTITIDALCAGSGGVDVTGSGTVVVNNGANTYSGAVTASNKVTLAFNAGCPFGTGAVTVTNATLKANSSGTVSFTGKVVCRANTTLAFNFTEKQTAPCLAFNSGATGNAMPAALNIRVTAADGLRPAGRRHVLTTGYDFTNTALTLVDPPEWIQSIDTDASGNIVLDVKSNGTTIIIH